MGGESNREMLREFTSVLRDVCPSTSSQLSTMEAVGNLLGKHVNVLEHLEEEKAEKGKTKGPLSIVADMCEWALGGEDTFNLLCSVALLRDAVGDNEYATFLYKKVNLLDFSFLSNELILKNPYPQG